MMSSSSGGATWEGLGGPVGMKEVTTGGIDPTLDSCCQREIESNRYRSALDETLRRHDVTLMAERRRRHLIPDLTWGTGCRCCYDPNNDGGEYYALMELREQLAKETKLEQQQDSDDNEQEKDNYDDSDSDDEFDYLLEDDLPGGDINNNILADMEERRRAELELELLHREAALQHGYGAHRQLHPARVLKAAGLGSSPKSAIPPPPAVVLHLFDDDSTKSASLDLFLETKLASSNRGTKFLRCAGKSALLLNADLAKHVLPNLRPTNDIPALIAIRDGNVVSSCPRLQGLSDEEYIDERAVEEWLHHAGVLLERPPLLEELCTIRPEELALYDMSQEQQQHSQEPRYDCGNPMCHKTFPHDHVGMKNEQQDGLVVQEEQILCQEIAATAEE